MLNLLYNANKFRTKNLNNCPENIDFRALLRDGYPDIFLSAEFRLGEVKLSFNSNFCATVLLGLILPNTKYYLHY